MEDKIDLVIAYVKRNHGGAFEALKYAIKTNKATINLCENLDFRRI